MPLGLAVVGPLQPWPSGEQLKGSAGSQGQGDGGREPHHVGLKEGWGREGSKSVFNRGEQIMEPSHPPAVSGAFLSRPLWSVFSLHLPEGQRQAVLKMLCLLRLEWGRAIGESR